MNLKYFKIFKKYRKRKYERELEKLQKDLAERGLIYGGTRGKVENWLREDYEDDISMKKEKAAEFEKDKHRQWILVILPFLAVVIAFSQYQSAENEKKAFNRPYLSITERKNLMFSHNTQPSFKLHVNNSGKLPARFTANLEGWPCTISPNQSNSDYILPNKNMELSFDLKTGCQVTTQDLCKVIENIKLTLIYGLPSLTDFQYSTVLKTKLIPATGNISNTIVQCGGGNVSEWLVPIWYIDKME